LPEVCLHWKNPRFTAFLDSNLSKSPHPASYRNRKRTWACFSPRNLPPKIRPDPSTFYLVIVVTNRQTDRQTNAGKNIIPRESFRGDKNPRFTAFLDSKIHTRLAIVTANELGLAFPPRNLPTKFRPDPSTFYLVIVVTNRQTDRQTNAGDYKIPRESFRGDNKM